MKKFGWILFCAALSLSLAACGDTSSADAPAEQAEPVVEQVEDMEYTVSAKEWKDDGSISDYEMSGQYTGEVIDGIPNGTGTFAASAGWSYVGDFEDGTFDGQGTTTWDDGSYNEEKGVYSDGLFTPTKAEFFSYAQYMYQKTSVMTESAKTFINAHDSLFPCETDADKAEAISLTDEELARKHIAKGGSSFGDKLLADNGLKVLQIFENNTEGYTLSWILASDKNGDYYAIYYLGSIDVYEDDRINVRVLPLGNSSFDNISGGTTLVVVCAGSIVEKV